MLERYKKMDEGYKKFAELIETTPASRRDKIIKVGLDEDFLFTERALCLVILWEDLLTMSPLVIAEITFKAKPNIVAMAICTLEEEQKNRFLINCQLQKMGKIKDALEYACKKVTNNMILTARLDMVGVCRELINEGKIPPVVKEVSKVKELFKI